MRGSVPASGADSAASNPHQQGGWTLPDAIHPNLTRVEERLRHIAADAEFEWVSELSAHLCLAGGKRLRPSMTLLWGDGDKDASQFLIDAATAVELLHLASLYHDDIIDRGSERRGEPSANRLWGSQSATIAGTLLFAKSLQILAGLGSEANRLASAAAAQTWRGQALECEMVFNTDIQIDAYREAVCGKTGALFALACQLGVVANADSKQTEAARQFGLKLGTAFQMVDDILDLTSDQATMGKPVSVDLKEGIYTLPTLLCLQSQTPQATELRQLLESGQQGSDAKNQIRDLILESASLTAASKIVTDLISDAIEDLNILKAGASKRALTALAVWIAARVQSPERV